MEMHVVNPHNKKSLSSSTGSQLSTFSVSILGFRFILLVMAAFLSSSFSYAFSNAWSLCLVSCF